MEGYPLASAFDPANNEIYVTQFGSGNNYVSAINGTTDSVTTTINVGA